jgi:putative restriction endonuclease
LLTPNWDFLFGKGFISFSDNGDILISKLITQQDIEYFNITPNIHIELLTGHKPYLKYHRENIFKG